MSKKTCLIIDDENQEEVFESGIKEVLKKDGYNVDLIFIHTTDQDVLNENQEIDKEKLFQHIQKKIEHKQVDVVATDFNLSDNNINGLTAIEIVRSLRSNVPIVLYSGKREEAIKSTILTEEGEVKPSEDLVESIKSLMLFNISEFVDRNDYTEKVNKLIKSKDKSIEQTLLRKLREFPDEKLHKCYFPSFMEKKLIEIAKDIEGSNPEGKLFMDEFIEQAICFMIDIDAN